MYHLRIWQRGYLGLKVPTFLVFRAADTALRTLEAMLSNMIDPRQVEYTLYKDGELPLLVRANVL